MLNHIKILFFSPIDWFFLYQRPQQLAWALSDYYPLIFSYPRTATAYLRLLKQKQTDPEIDLSTWASPKRNLELFHPRVLPQKKGIPLFENLNKRIFISQLKRLLEKRDWSVSVIWLTHPLQLDYLRYFPPTPICYDCMDSWSDLCPPHMKREIEKKEELILSKAQLVFVTSESLRRRIQQAAVQVHLVPNGVDEKHFSRAFKENLPLPEDLKNLKRPIVGYIGTIAKWLDFELITYVAELKKDYSFVFIGPTLDTDLRPYMYMQNVHFLNAKPYQILPDYLRHIDIGILPFKINNLAECVDPVKAYEYLAAGKQIVATNMFELRKFKELIKVSMNKDEFASNLEACFREIVSGKHDSEKRWNAILQYTWQQRAGQIRTILERSLSRQSEISAPNS